MKSICRKGNPGDLISDVSVFRELALQYREFAKDADIDLLPFRDPEVPIFSAQNNEQRQSILFSLQKCVDICKRTSAEGHKMSDSPALTWGALKEFGLRPPSDLFGHINNNSVIEMHSAYGTQLFRNFNFYKYCSYSVEELYTISWFHLYERDERITSQILSFAKKIFTKEIISTVPMNIPGHSVKERFSPLKFEIELRMDWAAPLFQEDGSPGASIVVESAEFIDLTKSSGETEYREPKLELVTGKTGTGTRSNSGGFFDTLL